MTSRASWHNGGVQAALASAVLFGCGTPAAKLLLTGVDPRLLAGLLYLGSGVGLACWLLARGRLRVRLPRRDLAPLAGAVVAGGVVGPLLQLYGLTALPASSAALLLNAEGVLTALLAWFVFDENVDRRVALGMVAIVAGAVLITAPSASMAGARVLPSLAIVGGCLAWAVDNNLTRKVSLTDAVWLAMVKGLIAGPTNLTLGLAGGAPLPRAWLIPVAMLVGLLAYGVSLSLFILSLRHLGTARAGAYFGVAPFFGVLLALALGEPLTWPIAAAGVLMALGVWLHVTERHSHPHTHEVLTHAHHHRHDDGHHDHSHPAGTPVSHSHPHTHEARRHTHPHYPDAHHRHAH